MTTWLRHARIVQDNTGWPGLSDVFVENGRIAGIFASDTMAPTPDDLEVDGGLLLPGHVNAHAHNHEHYLKGTAWGLPLEPYILANSPAAPRGSGLTDQQLYDRTLLSAYEMLRSGITAVADDVIHPRMAESAVEATLQAYEDSGMRARVSLMVEDSPWRRSIPLRGAPTDVDPLLDEAPHNPSEAISLYRHLLPRWAGSKRVSLMVSPSAPQRCTTEFLHLLVDLARENSLPFHIHVQETFSQRVHGPQLFQGRTMLRFLAEEGLLGRETMLAHAIWLDDEEIDLVAGASASVVHNPVSNGRLGSGVARVRDLLRAGVNVGLGTDGLTCNDALDLYEVGRAASLLSNLSSTSSADWLTPTEILYLATAGSSRAMGYPEGAGTLTEGATADIQVLDPHAYAFAPRNDAVAQAVFSTRTRDVLHVMVEGRLVVRDRQIVDGEPTALHDRVCAAAEEFWSEALPSLSENERLMPYVQAAYEQAVATTQADLSVPYRLVPPMRRLGGETL
jgi:5-methylthioadenosine/S-adenosylhomocysteine deaminase